MIIRIFKISTMQLATIPNKSFLIQYIEKEIGKYVPTNLTINKLIEYLPVENYCRVK